MTMRATMGVMARERLVPMEVQLSAKTFVSVSVSVTTAGPAEVDGDGVLVAVREACLKEMVGEAEKELAGAGGVNPFVALVDEAEGLDKIEELQNAANEDVYDKAVSILETFFDVEDGEVENLAPQAAAGAGGGEAGGTGALGGGAAPGVAGAYAFGGGGAAPPPPGAQGGGFDFGGGGGAPMA